jgi:hypothetical protein
MSGNSRLDRDWNLPSVLYSRREYWRRKQALEWLKKSEYTTAHNICDAIRRLILAGGEVARFMIRPVRICTRRT